MNVCQIISGDLWAGAECQAVNLLSELTKNGAVRASAITFNPGRLTDELRNLNIEVTCLSEERMSAVGLVREIRKHIDHNEVDIIHCHGHKEHILGSTGGFFSRKHPRAVRTLHGMPEPFSGIAKMRAAFFLGLQSVFMSYRTDRIVVVSEDMKRRLSDRKWAGKITCVHNGIDPDRVKTTLPRDEMRSRLGIKEDDFVIGTACRLVPVKRIDLLLEAFRQVKQSHPQTLLIICGDGPLRPELQDRAESLGMASRVKFLGHRDDIYNVMSTFDIFAMTSEHEGIPMVLLEGIALGIPIIASEVGGIPEIARKIDLDPPRAESMVDELLKVLAKDSLGKSFLRIYPKEINPDFTAKSNAQNMTKLYEYSLNEGKSNGAKSKIRSRKIS